MKITAIAFTAAVSGAAARTLSDAGATKADAPLLAGNSSLPPVYLQVPDFESCLSSETSNDGSSEMWCMPVEMPDGCSDESWTKLSVVNTELPLCSNGDAPLGSSAGSLPPAYLQVPDFESCLGTKDVGSYSIVCLPRSMPDGCAGESWAALGSEDMPMVLCDNDDEQEEEQQPIMKGGSGSLPPAYLQVPDFESCLGTKDVGSYSIVCLPVEMPDGCASESWAALGSEDMQMVLCDNDDEEEEQQPIMVGTEKTITCTNGENVMCNAGTYGCIDDSPTLCGATNARSLRGSRRRM